jgi:cytoskeletal protein RodZ
VTDPAKPATGDLAAFGRYLVQEREMRRVSREDVARATKLSVSSIEAIEAGDAARSPHRAYLVVYLRGYATAVGLDPDDVLLRYEEAAGPAEEGSASGPRRGGALRVLAAMAGLAVLAAALWALRRR